jgi:hypothetical protein
MSGGKTIGRELRKMISTEITRLFPLPNSPSGSASVDVNTETGYKFIGVSRECGTAPLGPPGGPISNTPLGMRAQTRPNEFGSPPGVSPPQDSPQAAIGIGALGCLEKFFAR